VSVWVDGCHLAASSVEELHAFADRMGWPRHWFHGGGYPHYDLVPSQRARAVAAGAVEVCSRAMIQNLRQAGDHLRRIGVPGPPEESWARGFLPGPRSIRPLARSAHFLL